VRVAAERANKRCIDTSISLVFCMDAPHRTRPKV
jgi:hypothetical protein